MRIVVTPQALKGSLTASQACQAIAQGIRTVYPHAHIQLFPMADGGEGTTQALIEASGGQIITQTIPGPLGKPVKAFYGILGDGETVVIETAACAGLPLLKLNERDPRITTTYGLGKLISAALDHGYRKFIIGIGGSATNDGGAGMAQALGAHLLTATGQPIAYGGAALSLLATISKQNMDPRLQECTFDIACDVTNPLCGPQGASIIYGRQKGASPIVAQQLDNALAHYASIITKDLHLSVADIPGAGAAGGLGAGLITFLSATLLPGAHIIIEALHIEEAIRNADLVITAEGRLDRQTLYGKSVGAIAQLAQHYQIPVIAIAGNLSPDYHCVYSLGIDAITVLPSGPMPLPYAMQHAALLMSESTERAMRLLKIGETMQRTQNTH